MLKKHSIRTMMYVYLFIPLILGIGIILLSSLSVSRSTRATADYFDLNHHLTVFYTAVQQMDSAARDYIYSESQEDYETYLKWDTESRTHIEVCQEIVGGKMERSLSRLLNMLDYYSQPLEVYQNQGESRYNTYLKLQYRCFLIESTSNNSYELLAEYVAEESEKVQRQWINVRNFLILILVLYLFAWLGFCIYNLHNLYNPIQILGKNTKLLQEGNYEFEKVHTTIAEIQLLYENFEEMAREVELNMETLRKNAALERRLLQKENENLQIKNLVTEANLRNLQAQINPHFLFNTMSMISKNAYIGGDTLTSEMMEKLSMFLRYALDKMNKNSTLFEEVESINNYLFIQQKRFGERVDFEMDIQEGIPNVYMPAIILQPLVENAIVHGVGNMIDDAFICIKVRIREGRLHLLIEDNGEGMTPDRLEELQIALYDRQNLSSATSGRYNSIGLSNVYQRLSAYYGANLQFTIESEAGCGTVIEIIIPVEEVA